MRMGSCVRYNGYSYECDWCDRSFPFRKALVQHCKDSDAHWWCERCERTFVSYGAKEAHLRYSSSHYICYRCRDCGRRKDFFDYYDWKEHQVHKHHWCSFCNKYFVGDYEREEHLIRVHNKCNVCGSLFKSPNNLMMHKQVHKPRIFECCCCDEAFKSFSGVLLHLEEGGCQSGRRGRDIARLAKYYSGAYLNDGSRSRSFPFMCPECGNVFSKLSGLYQHVEHSPVCSDAYDPLFDGELYGLRRFITRKL